MIFTAVFLRSDYAAFWIFRSTHMDRAPTIPTANAEASAGQQPRSVSLVTPVHEIADAFPAEHIYIGDEASESAGEPRTVAKRVQIINAVRGTRYQLIFFEEGFLRFRERKGKSLVKDHLLELRFLNMEPQVTRQFASTVLKVALGLGLTAIAAWLLAPWTGLTSYLQPAGVIATAGAIIALLTLVYRSYDTFSFYTASGSAEVLTIRANLGCLRRCRKLVPQISRAIRNAVAGIKLDEETYLRAEMQAHYRLRETGVITRETCSDGVSMILSKFG